MNEVRIIDANALKEQIVRKANSGQFSEAVIYGFQKAIWLIDNAPTVEPNKDNGATQYSQGYYDGFMSAKELITKEPERPKGEWITEDSLHCLYYCSNCRNNGERIMPYCPWCGADMRGDNND